MPRLRGVLALGGTAHNAVLRVHGLRPTRVPFRHGTIHNLSAVLLADSYHVSRLNTNTGRLTEAMFRAVVQGLLDRLAADDGYGRAPASPTAILDGTAVPAPHPGRVKHEEPPRWTFAFPACRSSRSSRSSR